MGLGELFVRNGSNGRSLDSRAGARHCAGDRLVASQEGQALCAVLGPCRKRLEFSAPYLRLEQSSLLEPACPVVASSTGSCRSCYWISRADRVLPPAGCLRSSRPEPPEATADARRRN